MQKDVGVNVPQNIFTGGQCVSHIVHVISRVGKHTKITKINETVFLPQNVVILFLSKYNIKTVRNRLQTIGYFKRKRLNFRKHYLENYVILDKTV